MIAAPSALVVPATAGISCRTHATTLHEAPVRPGATDMLL